MTGNSIKVVKNINLVVTPANLWEKALQSLGDEDKNGVKFEQDDKLDILKGVLRSVEEKKSICIQKGWKLKRKNGQTIPLRIIFDRMIRWVHKFKDVGDTLIQYDPGHAALPWAAVRFLLQVAINDSETYSGMIQGVEKVTSLITRYAMIEKHYIYEGSELLQQMSDAVVQVYASILMYLSKAGRYYARNTATRIARSIVQISDSAVQESLKKISNAEHKVEELARLIDSEFMRSMAESLQDSLQNVDSKVDALSSEFQGVNKRLEAIQSALYAKATASDTERDVLVKWLGAIFPDEEYEESLSLKVEGTCSWFLHKTPFRSWYHAQSKEDAARILWVHGGAGFGKSVLSASLVQYLKQETIVPVCFFFCIAQDETKQKPMSILRSWVAQLITENELAFQLAQVVFESKDIRSATNLAVWSLFQEICTKLPECIFVIDGFDECSKLNENSRFGEMDGRLKFLEKLFDSIKGTRSRILLVSRDDSEIRFQLNSRADSEEMWTSELEISREDTRKDIERVSLTMIDQQLSNKAVDLRIELASDVANKCDGMFLWIRLLKSRLGRGKNAVQLRKAVADAPTGLNKAYERELQDILALEEEDRSRAISILRWIFYAFRPLTVRELTEALLVRHDEDQFPRDELPDTWDDDYVNDQIRRLCGSLVTLQGKGLDQPLAEQTVQYVHFSVKEFLSTITDVTSPSAETGHEDIASACLQYLCYEDFDVAERTSIVQMYSKLRSYCFLSYASGSWYLHAQLAGKSENLARLIQQLFDRVKSNWILWSDVFERAENMPELSEYSQGKEFPNQLYYAAFLGLKELGKELIDEGFDVNRVAGRLGCALQAAAYSGETEMVRLLLQSGADPTIKCGAYVSPITASQVRQSNKSSEDILRLLAESGAFENLEAQAAALALAHAATKGGVGSIQALINYGISPDATTPDLEETAISIAASLGNKEVVELLIRNGASLSPAGSTPPLFAAALRDRIDVMRLLLDTGAPLSGTTILHSSTLNVSAENGSIHAVNLLLSKGASISSRNVDGWTPLGGAARNGHLAVVDALLAKGAAIDATNESDTGRAYFDHMRNVHAQIVETLTGGENFSRETVEADAWALLKVTGAAFEDDEANKMIRGKVPKLSSVKFDLSTIEAYGWSPLNAAAYIGHEKVCSRLLDAGADITSTNSQGWTPLSSAARNGKSAVVRLLLERGADPLATDSESLQVIHAAARGNAEVVKYILDAGADPNTLSKSGWTPLLTAANFGNADAVYVLLENGADINVICPDGNNALLLACMNVHVETVKVLLEHGVDMSLPNANGMFPLYYAVHKKHAHILKILLEKGADASSSYDGYPLLVYAAARGSLEAIDLLLRYGADINCQCPEGTTPLIRAAEVHHYEVVRLLLERGAKPNISNLWGETPLLVACKCHSALIARILKSYGADLSPTDYFGKSALDWALSDWLLLSCLFDSWEEAAAHVQASMERLANKTELRKRQVSLALLALDMMIEQYPDMPQFPCMILSRVLIQLGRLEEAEGISAFVYTIEDEAEDGGSALKVPEADGQAATEPRKPRKVVVHEATCDGCREGDGRKQIRGPRFMCTTCDNSDLCQNCFGEYVIAQALEKVVADGITGTSDEEYFCTQLGWAREQLPMIFNSLNRAKFPPLCIGHDFLEVPDKSALDEDGNYLYPYFFENADTLLEWLKRLRDDLAASAGEEPSESGDKHDAEGAQTRESVDHRGGEPETEGGEAVDASSPHGQSIQSSQPLVDIPERPKPPTAEP